MAGCCAVDPKNARDLWASAGAFLFTTQNARYSWLVTRPVVWAGEFDAKTGCALYRLYAQKRA
jgi:hypothetical protein